MSIIIRLQNLPLSAKSADIRQFFDGLNIPNGGVHIIGGEKGDAFIVFTSDEDARVAMRMDGKRIFENRVKLYLSSQMEMHHEIEKITKKIAFPTRQKSPVRRLSPHVERDGYYDKKMYSSEKKRDHPLQSRTRSPKRFRSPRRSRSPRKSRSPRRYSRSPRRRSSRSPKRHSRSPKRRSSRSPRRYSRSPKRLSRSPKRLSRSPGRVSRLSDNTSSMQSRPKTDFEDTNFSGQGEAGSSEDANLLKLKQLFGLESAPKEVFDWQNEESSKRNEQSLFEKKIAEVLASSLSSMSQTQEPYQRQIAANIPEQNNLTRSDFFNTLSSSLMPQHQTTSLYDMNAADGSYLRMLPFSSSTPLTTPLKSYVPNSQPLQYPTSVLPPTNNLNILSLLSPQPAATTLQPVAKVPAVEAKPPMTLAEKYNRSLFFVTFTGMKPGWDYGIIKIMLKGVFVHKDNIRYERDEVIHRHTGTIFVKFCNRDDYNEVLTHKSYYFKKRVIHVSETPESVFRRYFEIPDKDPEDHKRSIRYVRIKGLPYDVTTEQVLMFFEGFEIVDLYIVFAKFSHGFIIEGKAIGIGYVGFGNAADYDKAFKKDGDIFLSTNRTIHFMKTSKAKMFIAKQRNKDLLSQSRDFVPATFPDGLSMEDLPEKRPLCILVTGLPENVTRHPVVDFFTEKGAKPSFCYLPLDSKGKKSVGRAFMSFDSLLDFDKAQLCHGTKMGDNVIFVKQILHDEMLKCLPEYEKHLHVSKLLEKVHKPVPRDMNHPMDYKKMYDRSRERSPHRFDDDSVSRDSVEFLDMRPNDRSLSPSYGDKYFDHSISPEPRFRNKDFDRREKVTDLAANLDAKIEQVMYKSAKVENTLGHVKKRIQHEKTMLAASEKTITMKTSKSKYALEGSSRTKPSSRWSPEDHRTSSPEPSYTRKVTVRSKGREDSPMDVSITKNFRKRYGIGYKPGSPDAIDRERHRSPPRKVRRIPSPSPPYKSSSSSYSDRDPHYHKHTKYQQEAVVELRNVDTAVGSPELKELFIGFTIDINKIVRRVTERGEPTGDVRVTFESRKDAERAIRLLNGSYVNGVPVSMQLVG